MFQVFEGFPREERCPQNEFPGGRQTSGFPIAEDKIRRVLFGNNFERIEVRGAVVASQANLRFRVLSVLRPDMLERSSCLGKRRRGALMGKGTTSFVSRRCRHGLETKRLSGSGHFLFSFAGLCRYGGRFSAKTHFGAFYGLSTVVFSVKLRILRGVHSENNGFMLSEEVSPHGGKKTNSVRAFSV